MLGDILINRLEMSTLTFDPAPFERGRREGED